MKNFIHSFLYLSFFGFSGISIGQTTLNAYAKVTNIAASNQLTVTNVNITNHTFAVGQKVVIMQMQDNVIGANTANNSSFGDLSTIGSAGLYEVNSVASVSPATGTPTRIVLSANLANTYNIGTNSSVQLITFRNLGANYTTTSNITGLAWDGNVGGVVALEVNGTLTLNHTISADYIGFRGGSRSTNADETCSNGSYRTSQTEKAYKGEGIYKNTTANYTNGRGKIINGGGGGSQNNTGGGGGGNYTAGGNGGQGWQCTNANSGYGLGAISLSTSISASRIFMGGGGGGGQQNNSNGSNGGDGGGIIFLKANSLITNSGCTGIRLSANGESPLNSGGDGSGGGGAGGSIVLQVNSFSVNSACSLSIQANGGDGGDVTDAGEHGGGGGGGQGVIIFSAAQPTLNVTTSANNGAGGTNNTPATSTASSGSGNNNSGVINNSNGPLPTELIGFTGTVENEISKIRWVTAVEMSNETFTLERSADGLTFAPLGEVKSSPGSLVRKEYEFIDEHPLQGINYYRLKQSDDNGIVKYSWIITLKHIRTPEAFLFPNPASQNENISIAFGKKNQKINRIRIFDVSGKSVYDREFNNPEGKNYVELEHLQLRPGIYIVNLNDEAAGKNLKLIIQ